MDTLYTCRYTVWGESGEKTWWGAWAGANNSPGQRRWCWVDDDKECLRQLLHRDVSTRLQRNSSQSYYSVKSLGIKPSYCSALEEPAVQLQLEPLAQRFILSSHVQVRRNVLFFKKSSSCLSVGSFTSSKKNRSNLNLFVWIKGRHLLVTGFNQHPSLTLDINKRLRLLPQVDLILQVWDRLHFEQF